MSYLSTQGLNPTYEDITVTGSANFDALESITIDGPATFNGETICNETLNCNGVVNMNNNLNVLGVCAFGETVFSNTVQCNEDVTVTGSLRCNGSSGFYDATYMYNTLTCNQPVTINNGITVNSMQVGSANFTSPINATEIIASGSISFGAGISGTGNGILSGNVSCTNVDASGSLNGSSSALSGLLSCNGIETTGVAPSLANQIGYLVQKVLVGTENVSNDVIGVQNSATFTIGTVSTVNIGTYLLTGNIQLGLTQNIQLNQYVYAIQGPQGTILSITTNFGDLPANSGNYTLTMNVPVSATFYLAEAGNVSLTIAINMESTLNEDAYVSVNGNAVGGGTCSYFNLVRIA